MKKARTRFFAMTLAILIFSLYALPSSAQTVPESASQFLRAKAAVQLTASEEAEVKEAVLNGEINESNQEDVLKLAMAQYLDRTGTMPMKTALSSNTDNDEWIILQEVETAKPMSLNSVPSNQPREKQFVATAFLVLDEDGEKVTPSDAVGDLDIVYNPYKKSLSLPDYFIGGTLSSYLTGRLLEGYPTIDKVRVDKIVTTATYIRPLVGTVSSFVHSVTVSRSMETVYQKYNTKNRPTSGAAYTLITSDMGFSPYAHSMDWCVMAKAAFFTNAGNYEIEVHMYDALAALNAQ